MQQAMDDIGGTLRTARLARGLTLQDVAAATKIATQHLGAIERSAFDRLPPGPFRRGYVKSFAAAVGLDAAELEGRYRAQFGADAPDEPPMLVRADIDSRPLLERAGRIAAGVGLGLVAIWALRPAEPPRPRILEGAAPQAIFASLPASPVPSTGAGEDVALAAVADAVRPLRVELRVSAACWLSADADGERVEHRLLEAGERIQIEGEESITLRVGNAGAVSFSVNGLPGRSLGAEGEAVTVELTDDTLDEFVAAASVI